MSECAVNHVCLKKGSSANLQPLLELPFIDVVDESLVSRNATLIEFVALSYVRGGRNVSDTIKSDIQKRMMKGRTSKNAVPTVDRLYTDAIKFVHELGIDTCGLTLSLYHRMTPPSRHG